MHLSESNESTGKELFFRMLVLSIGVAAFASFSYFTFLIINLFLDFYRNPESVKLLELVINTFKGEDGVLNAKFGDGGTADVELSPGLLIIMGILIVFTGISAMGGLISTGLSLGSKMIMHACKPEIETVKMGASKMIVGSKSSFTEDSKKEEVYAPSTKQE